MEPLKTHGTALPQQELTRPVGGCPSGPRPEDSMRGGHEGANPHAGQRVATPTNNDESMNTDLKKSLTRLELYKILVDKAHLYGVKKRPMDIDTEERCLTVLSALYPNGIPDNIDIQNQVFKKRIACFLSNCETLYNKSKRNFKRFCKKNKGWLSATFEIEVPKLDIKESPLLHQHILELDAAHFLQNNPSTSRTSSDDLKETLNPQNLEPSTPPKHETFDVSSSAYANLSDRQKRRARKSLEESLEGEPSSKIIKVISKIVTDDTGEKLSKNSAQELEFVIKECLKDPTRPKQIANIIKSESKPKQTPYSPDEALCFMIDRKLSVDDYVSMQQGAKSRGFNLYPPYYKLQIAKKNCYPDVDIEVTEREAKVPLHDLLMHTFRRIIESCDERVSEYCRQKQTNTLYCVFEGSWGFDGSTGQSIYKQSFSDDNDDEHCLFATTFIPLRIRTVDGFVLWSVANAQSFRFCRPIKIQYRRESKDLIMEEKNRVEEEIKNLSSIYSENSAGYTVIGDPKLYLTVIDGKVFNVITNNSSQLRCSCCGATCSEFNNLEEVAKKPLNQEALLHGLSPLHAWIRIFEFLLHLGYKNDPGVQKWRVKKDSPEAVIIENRKKKIQTDIRSQMGLLVDVVRPNAGTTNDGNTARTALSDSNRKTFANILGIEEWLIEDLHTILVALSSGLEIDSEKFQYFCGNLAAKYVQKYKWYYMSVTLHKILMHGSKIIESIPLPIGMLSEQAGESRNKFWRYDREHHTRKLDRVTTVLDLFHRALESSDPLLSMMSISSRDNKNKRSILPEKVVSLLKPTMHNVIIHDFD